MMQLEAQVESQQEWSEAKCASAEGWDLRRDGGVDFKKEISSCGL